MADIVIAIRSRVSGEGGHQIPALYSPNIKDSTRYPGARAFDVLAKERFLYDSSIGPVRPDR